MEAPGNAPWGDLRDRRIVAMAAAVAFVPAWIVLGAPGLLIGFVAMLAGYWWMRRYACPRCRQPLVGARFTSLPDTCASCGVEVFGPVDGAIPIVPDAHHALRLSRRLRRAVAASEIAGGALVMLLVAMLAITGRAPWWYSMLLEGLGGLSIAAGVWLWRDDARGYALSRAVLLVQLVRIESAWLSFAASAGFFVDLFHTRTQVGLTPGFRAAFALYLLPGAPFGVSVNLWAAALLLMLVHARAGDGAPDASAPETTRR